MHKRGNGKRKPKRARRCNRQRRLTVVQRVTIPRLTLHQTDPIASNEDALYSLFYESYRGYTIYSTEQGLASIQSREGCLRIQGKYVCFPDVEQAKRMIKYFQAEGRTPQESMNRFVPDDAYLCLNACRSGDAQRRASC